MPIEVRKILRERFPHSGWNIEIETSSRSEVDISLIWKDKDRPTHQITVKRRDLLELLKC